MALNETGYCENNFVSFREWLVSVLQKKNKKTLQFFTSIKSMAYVLSIYALSDSLSYYRENLSSVSFNYYKRMSPKQHYSNFKIFQ